jgi:hypothetical protein
VIENLTALSQKQPTLSTKWESQSRYVFKQHTEGKLLLLLLLFCLYNPLLGLGRFFSFLILHTVGRIPWTGDQPVARPLPTRRTTQTE